MFGLRRSIARRWGRLARRALVALCMPALLFSSMGMNIMLPRPMDLSAMAAATVTTAPATQPTCSSCSGGMCVMRPGRACSCPMCALLHHSFSNTNTSAQNHASSSMATCVSAMPCSTTVRWLMMMTQLGWDVPPASHVYPSSRSTFVRPIPSASLTALSRLSVDPPPPRLFV